MPHYEFSAIGNADAAEVLASGFILFIFNSSGCLGPKLDENIARMK